MSPAAIPRRLLAPEPGWTADADVVVVGSGIAGLTVALRFTELRPGGRVLRGRCRVGLQAGTWWPRVGLRVCYPRPPWTSGLLS